MTERGTLGWHLAPVTIDGGDLPVLQAWPASAAPSRSAFGSAADHAFPAADIGPDLAAAIAGGEDYLSLFQRRQQLAAPGPLHLYLSPEGGEAEVSTRVELGEAIEANARRLLAAFRAAGRPLDGARVLVPCGASAGMIACFLACLRARAVGVPVPFSSSVRDVIGLREVCADCDAQAVLVANPSLEEKVRDAKLPPHVMIVAAREAPVDPADEEPLPAHRPDQQAPAYIQYSSGSTTRPRGILITHANLMAGMQALAQRIGGDPRSDCLVQWLPLYHDMGLISLLYATLLHARSVLLPPLAFMRRPLCWLEAVSRYGGTVSGGPSFAYGVCVDAFKAKRNAGERPAALNLHKWRLAFVGAERVRADVLEDFTGLFSSAGFRRTAFFPTYGLAEFTLMAAGGTRRPGLEVLRCSAAELAQGHVREDPTGLPVVNCGQVPQGHRLLIVDPGSRKPLGEGRVGEIWLAGPSIARGYWQQPQETAAIFGAQLHDGSGAFLRTGDLGFLREGELFVTGRIKEVIVVKGRNLYPEDIEASAERAHSALAGYRAAAFEIEGSEAGDFAIIQEVRHLAPEARSGVAAAIATAVARDHGAAPAEVILVKLGSLPRTTSGKVRRGACRAMLGAGCLRGLLLRWQPGVQGPARPEMAVRRNAVHGAVAGMLIAVLATHSGSPIAMLSEDTRLADLHLDSIRVMQLTHELAHASGVSLAPSLFFEAESIGELASRLVELLGPGVERLTAAGIAADRSTGSGDALAQQAMSGTTVRPDLLARLAALKLDRDYVAAQGDFVWWRDADGAKRPVLDLVGGFGAGLLGHNHPRMLTTLREQHDMQRSMNLQASARRPAEAAGRALAERVRCVTGVGMHAAFFSTGAEAVEAALALSRRDYAQRREAALRHLEREALELALTDPHRPVVVPEGFAEIAAVGATLSARTLAGALSAANRAAAAVQPLCIAVERAFHGRTDGARRLAEGGRAVLRVDVDRPEALAEAVEAASSRLVRLHAGPSGALTLASVPWAAIAIMIAEPVQGEGGIHELPAALLWQMRALCDGLGCLLFFDEVQCGLGRCGSFIAAEASGVAADGYIFGKALGGGVAKASAIVVRADRWPDGFGVDHTSTFGEDDISCSVALAALQMIEADDLPGRCRETGDALRARLEGLVRQHPRSFAAVRGRGLMLGLRLTAPDEDAPPLLRFVGPNLGYLAASWLLHHEAVRILPAVSDPLTLRIQPSAYLDEAGIEQAIEALEALGRVLESAASDALLAHLLDPPYPPEARGALASPSGRAAPAVRAPREGAPDTAARRRVAFLTYPTDPEMLRRWDPSLARIDDERLEGLIDRLAPIAPPQVIKHFSVASDAGASCELAVIGLFATSRWVKRAMRTPETRALLDRGIDQAMALAAAEGAAFVGLGAYLSIATDNGRSLLRPDLRVTTGNTLTVAASVEAVQAACRELGVTLGEATVAVVGAGGNIGAACAWALAPKAARVVLVAPPRQADRLRDAALDLRRKARGEVAVADELTALREADLVVSASSDPQAIIEPEHLGRRMRLICDVAVPWDVAASVHERRPDIRVVKGGTMFLPKAAGLSRLDATYGLLGPGRVPACMAETLLLGLIGADENVGVGTVEDRHVAWLQQEMAIHGFRVDIRA